MCLWGRGWEGGDAVEFHSAQTRRKRPQARATSFEHTHEMSGVSVLLAAVSGAMRSSAVGPMGLAFPHHVDNSVQLSCEGLRGRPFVTGLYVEHLRQPLGGRDSYEFRVQCGPAVSSWSTLGPSLWMWSDMSNGVAHCPRPQSVRGLSVTRGRTGQGGDLYNFAMLCGVSGGELVEVGGLKEPDAIAEQRGRTCPDGAFVSGLNISRGFEPDGSYDLLEFSLVCSEVYDEEEPMRRAQKAQADDGYTSRGFFSAARGDSGGGGGGSGGGGGGGGGDDGGGGGGGGGSTGGLRPQRQERAAPAIGGRGGGASSGGRGSGTSNTLGGGSRRGGASPMGAEAEAAMEEMEAAAARAQARRREAAARAAAAEEEARKERARARQAQMDEAGLNGVFGKVRQSATTEEEDPVGDTSPPQEPKEQQAGAAEGVTGTPSAPADEEAMERIEMDDDEDESAAPQEESTEGAPSATDPMPSAEESPTHGAAGADEGAGPSDSVRAAAKEQEAAAPATATDAGDAQPSVTVAATPAGERAAPEVDSRLESVMQQIDELKSSATTAGAVGADDSRSTMGSAPGEEGDASSQTTTGGSESPSADGPLQGHEEDVQQEAGAPTREPAPTATDETTATSEQVVDGEEAQPATEP